MAGMSNYLQNAILAWIKSTSFPSDPAAVFVGIHEEDPTDAASGAEVTDTVAEGGARIAVTFGSVSGNNTMSNDAVVDFGEAQDDATLTHFSVWDNATVGGGNMLFSAALTGQPIAVTEGQALTFEVGDLDVVAS